MYFSKTISHINNSIDLQKIIHRTAVRAIIREGEKILLVRSNLGYYKLPGGGVENGESHSEALVREVGEETGYLDCLVQMQLGIITEQRQDVTEPDACFQMESYHYICKLGTKEKAAQTLIGYELEEGYTPVWVPMQKAIDTNASLYAIDSSKVFIPRENYVFEWLKIHEPISKR